MIASGMLNFRCCACELRLNGCALRLEGKSQVGINPIYVFSDGRICFVVSLLHDSLHLLVLTYAAWQSHFLTDGLICSLSPDVYELQKRRDMKIRNNLQLLWQPNVRL
jgi:hypothetical protein